MTILGNRGTGLATTGLIGTGAGHSRLGFSGITSGIARGGIFSRGFNIIGSAINGLIGAGMRSMATNTGIKATQLVLQANRYAALNQVADFCGDKNITTTHNNIVDFLFLEKTVILQKCSYLNNLVATDACISDKLIVAEAIQSVVKALGT